VLIARDDRQDRASSNTTENPNPPTITAAQMVRLIHGSATARRVWAWRSL